MDYDQFIQGKSKNAQDYGFEPYEITANLFDWQKQVVQWAVRKGRAALFEGIILQASVPEFSNCEGST